MTLSTVAVLRPGDWVLYDGSEHQVLALAGTSVRLRTVDGADSVVLAGHLMAEVLRLPVADARRPTAISDPDVVVSAHPSAVLRGPPEEREKAFEALVSDLRFAAGLLDGKT